MGIFSRTRDIIAANVTDLLDKAEDPAKMIRMISPSNVTSPLVTCVCGAQSPARLSETPASPPRRSP